MPADRLLGTLLRSLQSYTDQQDTPRLLGTASSLLTTLNNPLNVTLLTSQILSAPAIWAHPDGLRLSVRCMSVFHSAAQALLRHDAASQSTSPDRDFSQLRLERTLPTDEWIRAVAKGADEHSPRWRHALVLGGLLLGFGAVEDESLSSSMRATLEEGFITAINFALAEASEHDDLGQQSITLVLNHCFPLISDYERSQLDYERLLPVLMFSSFRSYEGLSSAYFLGAIDLDVRYGADNQLCWAENSPSYQQIREMMSNPLISALGPLSRLIGHAVEHVRNPRAVTAVMNDLETFTKTLQTQWRQNKLARVDIADESILLDETTRTQTAPMLWQLLKTTMFAVVIVLRSAIGRMLGDTALATDDVALHMASQALVILRDLYFISARSGQATFSQYTFVNLTAVDVLATHPPRVEAFLRTIRPAESGKISEYSLDRNLDLFYLNCAEQFTFCLQPAVSEDLLVGPASAYLAASSNRNLAPLFEAAHSVMLAVFATPHNAEITNRHLQGYVNALFNVFPSNLSARQFRFAFKTLIQIASPLSPLSVSQPLLAPILLELLHERSQVAATSPVIEQASFDGLDDSVPLSEQAVLVLTVLDTLTQIPLDLLNEWLPLAADLVNAIEDEATRQHCKEHFWHLLVDGGMDPERSRVCHAWWSTAGGHDLVLYGREAVLEQDIAMSGALQSEDSQTKL